eukprot:jgi/Astpho2/8778/e_gw1.00128.33.1_t
MGSARLKQAPLTAETTIVGPHGELFMPNERGQVLMAPSGSATLQEWAFTGGRGLGGKVDADGNLILLPARLQGLIKVDARTRQTTILAARVSPGTGAGEGSEILFADDLDIASDGTIYFTDMAAVQPVRDEEGHYDLLAAHKANLLQASGQGELGGRLLAYEPLTGTTRVLLDQIWAANGVALAQDEASVVVSSTNTACLLQYWLTGSKAGTSEVLVRDLPGMIDSISTASDGGFWLAMPAPFTAPLVAAMKSPVMRWLVSWLPHRLQPIPPPHSAIIKVNTAGHVELFSHDDTQRIHSITAVNEYKGNLYLGHLGTDYVAEVHLKDLQ